MPRESSLKKLVGNREANIAVAFIVSAILATVGLVAKDLRILALIGTPIAVVSFLLSRNKIVVPGTICGLLAIRSLFALFVTGNLWMLVSFVGCTGAVVLFLRIAANREKKHDSGRPDDRDEVSTQ